MLPRAMALLSLLLLLVAASLLVASVAAALAGACCCRCCRCRRLCHRYCHWRFLSQQPVPLRFIPDALDKAAVGAAVAALSPPTAPFGSAIGHASWLTNNTHAQAKCPRPVNEALDFELGASVFNYIKAPLSIIRPQLRPCIRCAST